MRLKKRSMRFHACCQRLSQGVVGQLDQAKNNGSHHHAQCTERPHQSERLQEGNIRCVRKKVNQGDDDYTEVDTVPVVTKVALFATDKRESDYLDSALHEENCSENIVSLQLVGRQSKHEL
eukprot:SAG31_NODE_5605_length_2426_cov_1.841856_2_plen_121_part_00